MSHRPVPRTATMLLLAAALILPVVIAVIWGISALLSAMGDHNGGAVLKYVGLACGLLWAIDLICLVVVQGLRTLSDTDEQE